jgi:hypothetical protein
MGNVLVDNLKPGMTVNADVTDGSGRLLFRGGTVISKDSIRMLKTREVAEVDIQGIEEEKAETDAPVQPEPGIVPEPAIVNEPPKDSVSNSAPKGAAVEKEILSEEDEKKISIMQSLPFFRPFTEQELFVILDTSRWLRCSPGDIVVKEGDTEHSFYIILKGSIRIQKRVGAASMKKPISYLKKGQCFGEMSVLTGQPRSADAVAEEETYVLKIDADTLNKETDSFEFRSMQFKFYKIFCEILSHRLNMTNSLLVKPL